MLQKTLSEVESELKKAEPASESQTKGKRMVIEEIENSGDEGEVGGPDTGEASSFWFHQLLFPPQGCLGVSAATKIVSFPNFALAFLKVYSQV